MSATLPKVQAFASVEIGKLESSAKVWCNADGAKKIGRACTLINDWTLGDSMYLPLEQNEFFAWVKFDSAALSVSSMTKALSSFSAEWRKMDRKPKECFIQLDASISDYFFIIHESLKLLEGFKSRYVPFNDKAYSQEGLFQLSTFLGKIALRAETSQLKLRMAYNYLSYECLNWGDHPIPSVYQSVFCPSLDEQVEGVLKEMSALEEWRLSASTHALIIKPVELVPSNKLGPQKLRALLRRIQWALGSKKKRISKIEFTKNSVQQENPRLWNRVMITGWYGTETTGDKAIIGEIIHQLRQYNPDLHVVISSIDFRVSWQTAVEMGVENVSFEPIRSCFSPEIVKSLDAVIMGGGPLMESSQIEYIHALFVEANKQKKARVIYGCGVGPIHTDGMSKWISDIIKLSSVAFYRDQQSLDYALRLGGMSDAQLACDPAVAYVRRWAAKNPGIGKNASGWASLLRSQTAEYHREGNLKELNEKFSSAVQEGLISTSENRHLNLLAMHMYWRGNDDRSFNYQLKEGNLDNDDTHLELAYHSLDGVLEMLGAHEFVIAMRYHGHLFCIALGIPLISVDYTGKAGKVSNLLERTELKDWSMKLSEFDAENVRKMASQLNKEEAEVRMKVANAGDKLLGQLHHSYEFFWGEGRLSL